MAVIRGDGRSTVLALAPGIVSESPCGGAGWCGKCRVLIRPVSGTLSPPDDAERRLLSPDELRAGVRLACRCVPSGECAVFSASVTAVPSGQGAGAEACSPGGSGGPAGERDGPFDPVPSGPGRKRYGIAVDIGTTTIACALLDLDSSGILSRLTVMNSQRRFGADVISRVRAALSGHAEELAALVRSDVSLAARAVIASAGVPPGAVRACAVAANAVMTHLLLGLPCDGFAAAPFALAARVFPGRGFAEVFGTGSGLPDCPVRFAPAIGPFVGGDIVAGIAVLGLSAETGPELLIDLGTNAEMVLSLPAGSGKARYLVASAAAGPAFEGGHLSCGTGCVPGAVTSVRLANGRFELGLAGGGDSRPAVPVGICGSGLLDAVSCALSLDLVRKDGSLAPVCEASGILLEPSGRIRLTAADIREFQLAKAAVRAGVGELLARAGLGAGDVAAVYLAGGFGEFLSESSAVATGLLPPEFAGKTRAAGNTSLSGAVRMLLDPSATARFDAILAAAETVGLADSPSFGERFIGSMEFPG